MTSIATSLVLPEVAEDLLVTKAAQGDHSAFTELVRRRQQGVRRLLAPW